MQSRPVETEARGRSSPARPTPLTRPPAWQPARPRYRLADYDYSRELEKTFMTNDNAAPPAALVRLIGETLQRHGDDALPPGARADDAARAWIEA
ncbi:MAG TPA: hypothetical protein VEZ40_03935, partial [Pyrinomonadaceae bacterium]|nr:hypothetical protein [Pyrinomonadaceae bacterium]